MPEPKVDRAFFAASFPSSALHGAPLTASRQQGFNAIFDVWDEIEAYDSLEWLAYELATAWHETGATMLPVREGFKKTDAEAYAHVASYCLKQGISNYAARHSNGNSYYGRGYVQLTHAVNYQKMGVRLGVGNALYSDPDRVMQPVTAAQILIHGMMDGLFRPKYGSLIDYFNSTEQNWFDARDLVNGDKHVVPKWAGKQIGSLIAEYGTGFRKALRYAV